jgi:hypothetical protein
MATPDHVRNPLEWSWQRIKRTGVAAQFVANSVFGAENGQLVAAPVVRRIGLVDLKEPKGSLISQRSGPTSSSSASSTPSSV